MTVDEIVANVEQLLASEEGVARSKRVLAYLEALAVLHAADEPPPRIRMRKGTLFFATVGKLLGSRVTLDVRIRGRLVGEVQLRGPRDRRFMPANAWKQDWEKESAEWGHSSVLEYLRQRERELPKDDKEAEVQSALFTAMREKRGVNRFS